MTNATNSESHFYLRIDGADAPERLMNALLSVVVESSLHLPDVATLVIHDPQLHWTDAAALEPGRALSIHARTGAEAELIFDGELVELEPELRPGDNRLVVRAFDRMHRLNRLSHARSFENVSDADLVRKLAGEAGLDARVGPTRHVYPYAAQVNETNLAFLQRRAAALGYLLYADGSTLCCVPPEGEGPPVLLSWASGLREFRPRMSAAGQVGRVTVRGWDPAGRRAIVGQARRGEGAPDVGERRAGGELAAAAFEGDAELLIADRPVRDQKLAEWLAQAAANRIQERFIVAEGICGGNPAITAGAQVELDGVGERFGGVYSVTGAIHSYSPDHGYSTEFTVSGQHPATLLSVFVGERPAPASGLVIGIVSDNADPEGLGRVRVRFPWLSDRHTSDWARVVAPGGGPGRGAQFLPAVDDEVLVGFEQGDPGFPYIVGGLWNGRDGPPLANADAARNGATEKWVIRTGAGHTITLDDSAPGRLVIAAEGDLELEASERVAIKGKSVEIEGVQGSVNVRGRTINLN